jgi:hypothetical protein
MLPEYLDNEFYSGQKSTILKYSINDTVKVLSGPYRNYSGAVVVLDRSHDEPYYLVEFGDGTDELIAQSNLERIEGI